MSGVPYITQFADIDIYVDRALKGEKVMIGYDPARFGSRSHRTMVLADGSEAADQLLYGENWRIDGPIARAHRDMDEIAERARKRMHDVIDRYDDALAHVQRGWRTVWLDGRYIGMQR